MSDPARKKNAIERRLGELEDQWSEFADDAEARLLRWIVDADAMRMVDLFLEIQNEDISELPDLFIRFSEPFEDPARYGFALRDSLISQYEDIRDGIAEEGIAADWTCPEPRADDSDVVAFVRVCASFRRHYGDLMVNLVIALLPRAMSSPMAWEKWLRELMQINPPAKVRFLVVEDNDALALEQLAVDEPVRVVTIKPKLDMPQAYAELLREVPRSGPGMRFTRYYVALNAAAAVGNLLAIQRAAAGAMRIATEQNWPQMQVAINMALGSGLLAAGQTAAALQSYRKARAVRLAPQDPAASKLAVQAGFAEAAALVADGKYEDAAEVYMEISPLAEKDKDLFSQLESSRMAAYCHEVSDRPKLAWKWGQQALTVGAKLDDDARKNSTLPYVGEGLLRLAQRGEYQGKQDEVRQRMLELIGEDWDSNLKQGASTS